MRPFAGREVRSITASAILFEMRNLRGMRRSPHAKSLTQIAARQSIWSALRSPMGGSCSRSESAPHPRPGGSPSQSGSALPGAEENAVWTSDDRQRNGAAESGEEGNGGDAHTWQNGHNERVKREEVKRSAWDGTAVEDRAGAYRREGKTLRWGAGAIETSGRRERTAGR
jgi:hypothetical protein